MHPTDDGIAFHERSRRILADVEETEHLLARTRSRPQGQLRIDLPTTFGRLYFIHALPQFIARYPDIQLTITITDRRVDIIDEGVDATVRTGVLEDSNFIARKLYDARFVACASPAFLARHGEPRAPEDLARFRCLGFMSPFTEQVTPWQFSKEEGQGGAHHVHAVDGRLNIMNADALVEAAIAGVGIIYLLDISVNRALAAGQLRPLLQDWQTSTLPVSVLYPHARHLSAKVRAFADFVAEMFPLPAVVSAASPPA
ncbi:MAG: LysR family transcriptional regulator [Betaproteobacteria bacterium]|nr:LysR family transcriptional regulator [Betaproteobacteria bacterium]